MYVRGKGGKVKVNQKLTVKANLKGVDEWYSCFHQLVGIQIHV